MYRGNEREGRSTEEGREGSRKEGKRGREEERKKEERKGVGGRDPEII